MTSEEKRILSKLANELLKLKSAVGQMPEVLSGTSPEMLERLKTADDAMFLYLEYKAKELKEINAKELVPGIDTTVGQYLVDEIVAQKKKLSEIAAQMDLPMEQLVNIIDGTAEITEDLAKRLECVLGIDAATWLNLQKLVNEEDVL